MKRNKKLISLVAAIAMIFTMLSSFTFVNADTEEITQGLTLTLGTVDATAKTVEVTASFVGMPDGYRSGKVGFAIDSNIVSKVEVAKETGTGIFVPKADSVGYTVNFTPNKIDGPSGDIVTFKLTLTDAWDQSFDLTLSDDSNMYDGNRKYYAVTGADASAGETTIQAAKVAIPKNPSAPAKTSATPAPVATDPTPNPDATTAPTLAPIETVDAGITLTLGTVDKTAKTVEVTAGFVGMPDGYRSGKVGFAIPAGVKTVEVAKETGTGIFVPKADSVGYTVNFTPNKIDGPSGDIVTFKLTYENAPTEEAQIKLSDDSNMYDGNRKYYAVTGADASAGETTIKAANVNIPAFGADEPVEPEKPTEIDLSKAVTKTVEDTPDSDGESDYFIIPKVTVVDSTTNEEKDAEYGTDYVAVVGDTELTPAQYSNLINGHLGAPNLTDLVGENKPINNINDVIQKLKIRTYDKTAKVSAQLVNKDTGVIANPDDKAVTAEPEKEKTYTDPTLSAKASKASTTAGSGDTITVTATYDKKDYAKDGVLTITVAEDVLDLATSSGFKLAYTKADGTKSADDLKLTKTVTELTDLTDKGTVTITYKPGSVGTAKFDFKYEGKNEKDTPKSKTASASTKINKASDSDNKGGSSSSSSSSTGSTGIIARGNYATGTAAGGVTGLSDLNDAPWASEAITMLNYQNIVSGYEDGTFRPNGSITRAEYAQILINAIGHNGDSADTYFDDVPTDAWFYHNVAVASQLGIVSGYGDGNFGPYDLITREQMALMTQKAAQVMNVNLSAISSVVFDDDADIADWSKAAVYELANAGIINGMGDGTFAPKDNATRAQASVIIYNTFVK